MDRPSALQQALLAAFAALGETPARETEQLLTAAEEPFGISYWTLLRWARSGRLRAHRGGRGKLLFWMSDLKRAIEHEPFVHKARAKTSAAPDEDLLDACPDLAKRSS